MSIAGIIFANMHDLTITDLTKLRTMGSVPFGARYRLIDFPLSNMANSGISSVGVITKSNYQSLLDHLGSGGAWDLSRKTGGLRILPPYGNVASALTSGGLYRGRLEALANIIRFIRFTPVEYIVMCDCDVIVNIDFKAVLAFHREKGADITVVYGNRNAYPDEMRSKTILNTDEDGRVNDLVIRPDFEGVPETVGGEGDAPVNVSMNMFIMSKPFLLDIITEAASRHLYNFEVDIIQRRLNELKIYGYRHEGYYAQINSITTYHRANMELMYGANRAAVFNNPDSPVYTKIKDRAPAKYGLEACVTNSLIAEGCVIEGTVENSVLFGGVKVAKHSVVKNSILMQNTVVNEKCELDYVIADKGVKVGSYRTMIMSPDYPVFVDKGASV